MPYFTETERSNARCERTLVEEIIRKLDGEGRALYDDKVLILVERVNWRFLSEVLELVGRKSS